MDAGRGFPAQAPSSQPSMDRKEPALVPDEVLQYAYEHDLISDHTLNSFSITHLFSKLVQSTLPAITEDGFTDSSHLTYLEVPQPELRESLNNGQSKPKLLHEALRELTDDEVKSLTQNIIDSRNTRDLKLELPLLRTDNQWDMREFRKEMEARRDLRIGDHRLPLDPVTEEDGEGMQLPASARSDANELLRKIENEKLGITRSGLQFLADIMKDDYNEEDHWNELKQQVSETKWVKVSNYAISVPTCLSLHDALSS